jgi:8-oxo-dGTP diphosphatase
MTNLNLAVNKMHRIFGIKEDVEYLDREGVYLIPCRNTQVGVVQTPKGYFFLGGGLENGESHLDCIERECIEEVGCSPCVEGRLCSAEAYIKHPTIGYFHPIQTYYFGTLLDRDSIPIEKDHILCWIEYDQLKGKMFLEMQNWALEELSAYVK